MTVILFSESGIMDVDDDGPAPAPAGGDEQDEARKEKAGRYQVRNIACYINGTQFIWTKGYRD